MPIVLSFDFGHFLVEVKRGGEGFDLRLQLRYQLTARAHRNAGNVVNGFVCVKLNAELSLIGWPSITKRKAPMADADAWKDKTGKLAELKR